MSAPIEHVARSLRNARHAKGLSQRELSVNSVVPQGHISKIENAAVDLRVSSLVALARALDLELMLVPRSSVAAVRSMPPVPRFVLRTMERAPAKSAVSWHVYRTR
jgi:transcriptional regulator with XRE-family HTH domain